MGKRKADCGKLAKRFMKKYLGMSAEFADRFF
jgi:hypothetical protein